MSDIEVALELLKVLLPYHKQTEEMETRDELLALYRKCYETVRSVQTVKPE